MIDSLLLTREIGSRLKYLSNANDTSYYKVYKMPRGEQNKQIRISNHGTYLRTWIDKDYDPSLGVNISIAFTEDGVPTNDCLIDDNTQLQYTDCNPCIIKQDQEGVSCKPRQIQDISQKNRSFFVTQYVYNCQFLNDTDINLFVTAIKYAAKSGKYIDPLANFSEKAAKTVVLNPVDKKINEQKTYNKMKKVIRLTENDLHRIVRNSVKRIMKESIANHDYIELNGNAIHTDPEYGKLYATDIFLCGNEIRVNWNSIDGQHGGVEGNLFDEDIMTIWNILQSIKK